MSNGLNFSYKYQPLFELLEARNLAKEYPENEYYQQLKDVSIVMCSGGRDSGKTFVEGIFDTIAAKDYGHRILATRYTMSSTDNSLKRVLAGSIERLGCEEHFSFANNTYKVVKGTEQQKKGYIAITGQKTSSGNQSAKLKSLEDFTIFQTDEGEELQDYDEFMKIKRSMRGKDLQCLAIVFFNPPKGEHFLREKFYKNVPLGFNGIKNNVLYIHTTYLDMERENIADHNFAEYEDLRINYELWCDSTDEERELLDNDVKYKAKIYETRILGGFEEKQEGVVYEHFELKPFNTDLDYCFGLDYGSNDPDALTRVAVDHHNKEIYIKQEYFKNNTSVDGLKKVLINRCGYSDMIVADTSGRRLTTDYRNEGLNIKKAQKRDKLEQIKKLKGYKIFVDPESYDVITAFNNYRYHDKKAGIILHDFSDLMDSWRYGAYELINPRIGML